MLDSYSTNSEKNHSFLIGQMKEREESPLFPMINISTIFAFHLNRLYLTNADIHYYFNIPSENCRIWLQLKIPISSDLFFLLSEAF